MTEKIKATSCIKSIKFFSVIDDKIITSCTSEMQIPWITQRNPQQQKKS